MIPPVVFTALQIMTDPTSPGAHVEFDWSDACLVVEGQVARAYQHEPVYVRLHSGTIDVCDVTS